MNKLRVLWLVERQQLLFLQLLHATVVDDPANMEHVVALKIG
jgi:hypothetical protein